MFFFVFLVYFVIFCMVLRFFEKLLYIFSRGFGRVFFAFCLSFYSGFSIDQAFLRGLFGLLGFSWQIQVVVLQKAPAWALHLVSDFLVATYVILVCMCSRIQKK